MSASAHAVSIFAADLTSNQKAELLEIAANAIGYEGKATNPLNSKEPRKFGDHAALLNNTIRRKEVR